MNPRGDNVCAAPRPRSGAVPLRLLIGILGLLLMTLTASTASAQPGRKHKNRPGKKKPVPAEPDKASPTEPATDSDATVKEKRTSKGGKEQVFDFTGLNLEASMRTPQLLYFLDRANEELQRASLERRSFVPEMVRSIAQEGL